jgi:hypothetical protein
VRHRARGNFGYLYLVELEVVYNTISNIPYVTPFNPGNTPNLVNLFGTAVETAKIEWQHNHQAYNMHQNVNTALITVFKQAIDPEILSDMETDNNILSITDFIPYFDAFMRTYGRTDPLAVNRIKKEMEVQWDPLTQDLPKLLHQLWDGMRFLQYISQLIDSAQLLHLAELNIPKSGHLKNEYSQWKMVWAADRTWDNFVGWWKEKIAIWKTLHQSAGMFGYGGAAQEQDVDEVNNLNAATNAANAATFQQLTASNAALAQQLQALQATNAQLMQAANNVQQMPAIAPPPIHNGWMPPQMPPQQYFQPPPQQQFIAPQVQQQYLPQ